ncbi:MAG TPA: hypothetical protein VMQ86_01865 [Bryobacteraceae bacterium]|jgi:hypothetical protein|nr:hypothetical protein [Bryobacteraceae bacterium]
MTTAQTNANRQNAKKSTGPRTPQGKTISSRNSLVHGMTSGKFLPPDADPQEFFQLLDQFRARFQPFDEVEDALVEPLVAAEFKMRSVRYLDAGLFHYQAETNPMPEQFNKAGRSNSLAWAFHGDSAYYNSFSKLMRYEGFLQREFSRALRDLSMLQADRRAQTQAEAAPPAFAEPESPAASPKTEETNRTQSPGRTAAPGRGFEADPPQNPNLIPFPVVTGGSPKR